MRNLEIQLTTPLSLQLMIKNAKIKHALERLHSRLDETEKEKAYKWTTYYQSLVDGGSEA